MPRTLLGEIVVWGGFFLIVGLKLLKWYLVHGGHTNDYRDSE